MTPGFNDPVPTPESDPSPPTLPFPSVSSDAAAGSVQALEAVLLTLQARTGHDFGSYKLSTVWPRVERRMQALAVTTLAAYRDHLQSDSTEPATLMQDLLVGVTNFFRDAQSFDALRPLLQSIMADAGRQPSGLRGWVAGCATGEEAYSLAMMLCEAPPTCAPTGAPDSATSPPIHLFATDIDEQAIATARLGSYPASISADVSEERLRRFFDREHDRFRVRKSLRQKVMFAKHNVLQDPPFSRLNFISCRNLLIYLDRSVHARVLDIFHLALQPGGYLFLGSLESAESDAHLFTAIDRRNGIFRANLVSRSSHRSSYLFPAVDELPKVTLTGLHQQLRQQQAPPSVLVDSEGDIVDLGDGANRYLQYASGVPSHRLLTLVHPELRPDLRPALHQAFQSGNSVEARPVRIGSPDGDVVVTMTVRPVRHAGSAGVLAMVVFNERDGSPVADVTLTMRDGHDPALTHLEEELRRVTEQLHRSTETSTTAIQDLTAWNEELQAVNEELRVTSEELETSREALQSINEELLAVNQELKSDADECAKTAEDLQHLIASTGIAAVFVDRQMIVRRFTSQATRLFNLIPSDVGRSLLDITHRLDHEHLADDAAETFRTVRIIEREVRGDDGRCYLMRVLPYRSTDDLIEGAVLAFVDVTGLDRGAEPTLSKLANSTGRGRDWH